MKQSPTFRVTSGPHQEDLVKAIFASTEISLDFRVLRPSKGAPPWLPASPDGLVNIIISPTITGVLKMGYGLVNIQCKVKVAGAMCGASQYLSIHYNPNTGTGEIITMTSRC